MLSFTPSLSPKSDAFALFVSEKYEYRDNKRILSKDIRKKIDSFLKSLKEKKNKADINSFDISDKKKCFVIKIKQKYEKYYFEEIGGTFFTHIKNSKYIDSIDLYADSLNEKNNELKKKFSSCYKTLMELGVKRQNLLFAFNKTESMNDEKILEKVKQLDLTENKNWIAISAKSGKNIEKLKMLIKQNFDSTTKINSVD